MRDERAYLTDILQSAQLVLEITRGKTEEQFTQDVVLREAVLRRLGIIGEAARFVSMASRQLAPEIPWDDVVSMRNILIHVYFGINMITVWNTVTQDLSPLIAAVERILTNRF